MLRASSSDTVRRRIYTGKPARLLKSKWTDAWDAPDAPEPLPMPLQNILVSEAHQRMNESDDPVTVAMPVGQIVGRMNEIRPVADIIAELVSGFEEASKRLDGIRELTSLLGRPLALLVTPGRTRRRIGPSVGLTLGVTA